jgi:hypothetical protein
MRLLLIAGLLSLAVIASGQTDGKDDASSLIQELAQLPQCAVCIVPYSLPVSDNTNFFVR